MKKIKELTKEYNLLLTEFDKLKKMKDELKSYYPDTKDLKNKNNKVKKELKKIFVGTIFLPGVSKIERIQHRYFLKLLKKLELTDKDKKLVYEIDLEPYEYKKVKGVEKLKNSNVEEQLKVYANSIAKITSSSQGTIAKLLGKKILTLKG
jgi:hypothetical protein